MRSEKWSSAQEIKKVFKRSSDEKSAAGPVVFFENGEKYIDTDEAHICVIGRTGKGKSQCASLPYMREIFLKKESLIMLDPKGEGYRKNACFVPKEYRTFCIDFRHPSKSPAKVNPLLPIYRFYKSVNTEERDLATSMLSEFWEAVYPHDPNADRFWTDSACQFAKGMTYLLFETASENQISINNVSKMMLDASSNPNLKSIFRQLPADSLARRNLASYVDAPNDTRLSIHSVAAQGVEIFSRSLGLIEMLSCDSLNLSDFDVETPFFVDIIIPDETNVYDKLAGILVSQMLQHLIRTAQDVTAYKGRLPVRVNVILEELGSVGKSIPTLDNLMVAGRSRGVRLMLVLQSYSQLDDIYGKSKAETILENVGITIGFSTGNIPTLKKWSECCGEKTSSYNRQFLREPLITPSQLMAMGTCTALVLGEENIKYIAHFPLYDGMYDNSKWQEPSEWIQTEYTGQKEPYQISQALRVLLHRNQSPVSPFEQQKSCLDDGMFSSLKGEQISMNDIFKRIDNAIARCEELENEHKGVNKNAPDE